MNWQLFLSTFTLIFLAELPDKTALAGLMLATRLRPLAVFCGVAVAFLIQTVIAVSFGKLLTFLPESTVHRGAGFLFLIFAAWIWFRKEELDDSSALSSDDRLRFFKQVWSAFLVIFIAEWGDMTQLATATLVARHQQPWTIGIAAVLALWAATAMVVIVGKKLKPYIKPQVLNKIAAVVFALVGIYFLVV